MCRARISNRPIRLITSGCKDLLEAVVMDQLVFVRGGDFEQVIDDVIRRDAVAFGRKIDDQPVPQHGLGQRLDVFHRDVRPSTDQRAGLSRKFSVMAIDLNDFKHTHDAYGHPRGDAVLKDAGAFLVGHLRHHDVACRTGGDEFSILLPDLSAAIIVVGHEAR